MQTETIAAIATPLGTGGIAVIRVSGNEAKEITDKSFKGKVKLTQSESHRVHYGKFYDEDTLIDIVLASVFTAPNSYTGEDIIEISCHGGILPARLILDTLIKNGASYAQPGEFTKRAFLNGKIDLAQAEAIADLIHSVSIPGAQTSAKQIQGKFTEKLSSIRNILLKIASLLELELDFAEDNILLTNKDTIEKEIISVMQYCQDLVSSYNASEILRSGYYVAIAGYPNSGKSTLFNALLERPRSIVSSQPGTTRDYIEESIYLGNIPIRITDTAGLRDTSNLIEIEGIKLVESVLARSNLILIINDASVSFHNSDSLFLNIKEKYKQSKLVLLNNKTDLISKNKLYDETSSYNKDIFKNDEIINIAAKYGTGIDRLRSYIEKESEKSKETVKEVLLNRRQEELLKQASSYIEKALITLRDGYENEIISIDIRKAAEIFGKITGENFSEEVLNNIFSRFCIGK